VFCLNNKAMGPGCPDLGDPRHGQIVYYIDGDILRANVTCNEGFRFVDVPSAIDSMTSPSRPLELKPGASFEQHKVRQITCSGYFWSDTVPDCKGEELFSLISLCCIHNLTVTSKRY